MREETWIDGIKYGRMLERDRIIKLLEADVCPDWTVSCCDGACAAYKDAIALIKEGVYV